MPYTGKDKVNKPVILVSDVAGKKVTVKQTAAQCHCLLYLMPLMIGDKFPPNNAKWELYVQFLDVLDFILAPELDRGQLLHFSQLLEEFLREFYSVYENIHIKPKGHFMLHYPKQYETFGPLIHNCTLRFEGKHSYFKGIMKKTKNFKSPCYTMATRHQYMQCWHHQAQNYLSGVNSKYTIKIPEGAVEFSILKFLMQNYPNQKWNLYKKVSHQGVTYSQGHAFLIKSDEKLFAKQLCVTAINGKLTFIVTYFKTLTFDENFHSYIVSETENLAFIYLEDLQTHIPMPVYEICGEKMIILPHFVK